MYFLRRSVVVFIRKQYLNASFWVLYIYYIYFGSSNKVWQIYQKVIDFNVTLAIGAIILFNHQNRTDLTKDKVVAKSHPVYFALGCGLCVQEPQYLGVFKTQFMERLAVGTPPKPRGSSPHSFFIATIFHIGCFQEHVRLSRGGQFVNAIIFLYSICHSLVKQYTQNIFQLQEIIQQQRELTKSSHSCQRCSRLFDLVHRCALSFDNCWICLFS